MPFFKCILEIVFCEGVQHCLLFCLNHLICVICVPFSFICNWENRKIGWVGDDSHVVFSQKFLGEKGSVRWCVVMMQQPVLLSPKFMDGVFAHFNAVTVKYHSSMWN
jgi:hypothetical protein